MLQQHNNYFKYGRPTISKEHLPHIRAEINAEYISKQCEIPVNVEYVCNEWVMPAEYRWTWKQTSNAIVVIVTIMVRTIRRRISERNQLSPSEQQGEVDA